MSKLLCPRCCVSSSHSNEPSLTCQTKQLKNGSTQCSINSKCSNAWNARLGEDGVSISVTFSRKHRLFPAYVGSIAKTEARSFSPLIYEGWAEDCRGKVPSAGACLICGLPRWLPHPECRNTTVLKNLTGEKVDACAWDRLTRRVRRSRFRIKFPAIVQRQGVERKHGCVGLHPFCFRGRQIRL